MTRKPKSKPTQTSNAAPTKGGSYIRQADGSLSPATTPEPQATAPTDKEA